MQGETQKPQNYENNENRPEHLNLLCSLREHPNVNFSSHPRESHFARTDEKTK